MDNTRTPVQPAPHDVLVREFPHCWTHHEEVIDSLVQQAPLISADTIRLVRQISAYYHQRALGQEHADALHTALHLYIETGLETINELQQIQ